ncbi:HMG-box [Guyanagaster necrorhizus]|uniref:HMG-box n=1 Tax=Guyanagaster necrorhizus TaxID=856835 RepID=A0A9P8AZ30_9AGAR|nr:HMG-box [Guyanagaster necrorhizus MCA 3950]KAG7451537.1 HMG-box [Guyanagaster necrorhizus MCA 3950]
MPHTIQSSYISTTRTSGNANSPLTPEASDHTNLFPDYGEFVDCEALRAQTLNADGTPKRPMNAFMIFARLRRPQISAENHALRTGDVSKILSKEWATMHFRDKKWYQDQAKKLKAEFKNKYPHYVYRRKSTRRRQRLQPNGSAVGSVKDGPAQSEWSESPESDLEELWPRRSTLEDPALDVIMNARPSQVLHEDASRLSREASYSRTNNVLRRLSQRPAAHVPSYHVPSFLNTPFCAGTPDLSYRMPMANTIPNSYLIFPRRGI